MSYNPRMVTMDRIQDFLAQKRFAFIGVSRQEKDFSRMLFREFRSRGYLAVPVHPGVNEIEGAQCFPSIADVAPPVDSALLMTPPDVTDSLVWECAKAGVRRVWIYRHAGTSTAVKFCEDSGISVISGECPYMFLPGGAWIHKVHGLIRKIGGTYPR